ncbi:hypothetical protein NWP22_09700 [Anabaenopsis tanganyikae CS-531]|uniref:Uncharacterized protein n=2 Tax=Anabaenopsis TaxID=110103 RepID=A0ABT5AUY1_9CYAN|nr:MULTISPECIES: hypothetical protein [Anabaenopsis]MDB9541128.1 hypothetical protein [Anabaenopsis arnoldii]MDH6093567.1 hypothetical protein [Anabaenopsis arnoldii]MDH6106136.1 hypothetical protein [Anabaenopsis tanganyikae CS-531]
MANIKLIGRLGDLLAATLGRSPWVLGTPSHTSRFLTELSY